MKEIPIKKYVRYLFGIAILLFILNKLYLRPWIVNNELSNFFLIITYSLPNFIEAILGTLLLTGILLQGRKYFHRNFSNIKDTHIHITAVSIASIYVISQELKFHNLGGNNVYDPYDMVASLIGLIFTFGIIQFFGFTEELKIDVKKRNIEE